jgi:predicted glycoside hydrolase/deacetylase ChbG (UPF0249 family)
VRFPSRVGERRELSLNENDPTVSRRALLLAGASAVGLLACRGVRGLGSAAPRGTPSLAEWLGHPADARLLIVHADDAGIARSANAATIEAFDRGSIDSASVMVPCPAFAAFAEWARARARTADVGVHLTFTSQPSQRWGPVSGAAAVPSLVDADGMFPAPLPATRTVNIRELELETRAQIALARVSGLALTHLDGHQHILQLRSAESFDVLVRVSRDERLPFRFARAWMASRAPYAEGRLAGVTQPLERLIAISRGSATPDQWAEWYAAQVRDLPPGLSELFVHLGHADAELRAVVPDTASWGAEWRARDLAMLSSPVFTAALAERGVIRIGWRAVRDYQRWLAARG